MRRQHIRSENPEEETFGVNSFKIATRSWIYIKSLRVSTNFFDSAFGGIVEGGQKFICS